MKVNSQMPDREQGGFGREVWNSPVSCVPRFAGYKQMMTGLCLWFDEKKGYGFIKPDDGGDDVFVHFTSIEQDVGYRKLKAGEPVSFVRVTKASKPQAMQVRRGEHEILSQGADRSVKGRVVVSQADQVPRRP